MPSLYAVVLTLSASQISTYRDECKRKWGFKSIAKIETPQHPSAALGTEVDNEQLQPYLRDGRGFDYTRDSGYIAASALAFLPQPKTHGLELQKHFTFRSLANRDELSYRGYQDLWMPNGGMPLPEGFVSDIVAVCDFKTTGNVKSEWVKTPEMLETDVQSMMYATNAMVATPARVVDLVWLYMGTKGWTDKAKERFNETGKLGARAPRRSHLRIGSKHVLEQFREIDAVGIQMMTTRREIEALGLPLEEAVMQLPANPEACEGYGGCPFRSRCNLSPSAFTTTLPELESIDMSNTAALLAQLKAKRTGAVAAPVVEVVGINPPESKLPPPAPATPFVTPAAALVEAIETGTLVTGDVPVPAEPKRKPGRPKKDPLGADAMAYTGGDEASRHQRIGALVVELLSLVQS